MIHNFHLSLAIQYGDHKLNEKIENCTIIEYMKSNSSKLITELLLQLGITQHFREYAMTQ